MAWQLIGVNKHSSKFNFNKKLNGLKDEETHVLFFDKFLVSKKAKNSRLKFLVD